MEIVDALGAFLLYNERACKALFVSVLPEEGSMHEYVKHQRVWALVVWGLVAVLVLT